MTAVTNNVFHASEEAVKEPGLAAAPDPTALVQRLDSVDEELMLAERALHELVCLLEPVLPVGFGQEAVPATPSRDPGGLSPLTIRLGDLAGRAHSVVLQLRTIAAAVDL